MHPLSSSWTLPDPKPRLSTRRRLSTSWMRTLRTLRFRSAGRAFTRCVPTSDVSCRLPAPAHRLLPDRQLPPRALLSSGPESVLPRDQNRSTVASPRGAISSVARRWRNDSRRLPSYRDPCLPPQTRAHSSHPGPTPFGAGQNHGSCLPCDVLALHPRTASLGRWADPASLQPRVVTRDA